MSVVGTFYFLGFVLVSGSGHNHTRLVLGGIKLIQKFVWDKLNAFRVVLGKLLVILDIFLGNIKFHSCVDWLFILIDNHFLFAAQIMADLLSDWLFKVAEHCHFFRLVV